MLLFEKDTGRSGPLRLLAVAAVLLAVTLAAGSTALARTPLQGPSSSAPSENPSADRGLTDEREVEAFLDGCVGHQLEHYDIPGATVSVVNDGEVLFAKGYGQANVEKREPVVADETLFRIASISKLFTATAVVQLVEEGKLDLDTDVNAYLDGVRVPDTYPGRPVTLRHLLTHTAGFEERFTGSGARNAADVETLGAYVATQMPARVRPPGEVTAYSNYGMSLAGYIVQEVSGMPYERYVEENILAPLGMESTTAAQPPPPKLRERLATGYNVEGGEPVARPLEYLDDAPAGTASTTATDMTRFMIAHLQNGRYGDVRILEESTAEEMHQRQFAHHPRLDGMAYGFYEQTINGERTIQHGGNLRQFHANLVLLPEQDVGIFVAYNSYGDGGDFAEYELVDAFLDRYYPEPPPPTVESSGEGASRNAERLAGSYRITRSNHTGFEKVLALLTGANVTANEDGSITTTGGYLSRDLEDTQQRWVEVKPLLFRAEDRNEYIAFREDGDGRALYLSGDADPTVAYEKVSPYEAPRLHLGLLAGSLSILMLTAVAWPAGALISRRYKKRYGEPTGDKSGADTKTARRARILAWGVCAFDLLFVIGVALAFSSLEETLAYGASPSLIAILTLPLPSAVLAAGVLVYAVLAWERRYWGVFGRLHYSLVALSALTFVALLGYYNLLGFQF
jgi:CubicO group peptidase (beta-lactamase class C family)